VKEVPHKSGGVGALRFGVRNPTIVVVEKLAKPLGVRPLRFRPERYGWIGWVAADVL
jgi:hypothetical protein